jgi:DNA helicase-2/ATP-dependent DNA helicase PcrA
LQFEGTGPNAVIQVKFVEIGVKRLVMQYAKLQGL